MRPGVPDIHITDRRDAEVAEYRALAGQAVLALILGLFAPFALVDPMLWSIPVLGAMIGWWALRRIKNSTPEMAGRKIAVAGLLLSLLFLAAAPTDWLVYRWTIRNEAREFSSMWLRYLTEGKAQLAYQLSLRPRERQSLDDRLWAYYRETPRSRQALENFVKAPTIRTLLALGPKAQVRFDQTTAQSHSGSDDEVDQVYAVTFDDAGEKKSFFVLVRMIREKLPGGGAGWRIVQAEGGVRPEGR